MDKLNRIIDKLENNKIVKGNPNLIVNEGILSANAHFKKWGFCLPQHNLNQFISKSLTEYKNKYTPKTFENIKLILNSLKNSQGSVWQQDFLSCEGKQGLIQIFDIQYKKIGSNILMIADQIQITFSLAPDFVILHHYVHHDNWFSSHSANFTTIHEIPKTLTPGDIKCLKNLCSLQILKRQDIIEMIKQQDPQSYQNQN